MRAIDADALINRIVFHTDWPTDEKEAFEDEINAEPTITPERKAGKWERHYSRPNVYADLCWHCSECGYKSSYNWANHYNFCPNCGSKMEKKEC